MHANSVWGFCVGHPQTFIVQALAITGMHLSDIAYPMESKH